MAAGAAQMRDTGGGREGDIPALFLGPMLPVDFFGVHEEFLVKPTDLVEHLAANHQAGADNKIDIAFWRPTTGEWYVLRSEDQSFFSFPFGASGDIPAPADYDGDGKTDAAVFRPSNSTWFVNKSTGGTTIQAFGVSGDVPIPGQ